ncbi:MAG: helix-turn-helix transcriptional regulator, partial [bacterium]
NKDKRQKIVNKVMSIMYNFSKNTNVYWDDIGSETKYILIKIIKKLNKKYSDNALGNVLLAYLEKALYHRLYNKIDEMLVPQEDKNFNDVIHLSSFEAPPEKLFNKLSVEDFSDKLINEIYLDGFWKLLSPREKEVYALLRKGYDHGYIANKLKIDRRDVYRYKERIKNKIK